MNRYDVKLSQNAESYYKRTDANTKERLERCFEDLEVEPTDWSHPRIKKLRGELSGLWRYRVGDLRVVYRVKDQQKVVDVVAIGPRGDILKNWPSKKEATFENRKFKYIKSWQKARELTSKNYQITSEGKFSEDYGLRDQIQRASVSNDGKYRRRLWR